MKHLSLAALAVLALVASCTSGTTGIFAGIESEQKVVSLGGMNKYATVVRMAEDTTNHVYYATGGRALFTKSTSGTTWTASTVGGNSAVAAVGVAGGSNVFAVAGGKLWSLSGSTWSDVTPTSPSGLVATDLLPVVTGSGNSSTQLLLVTSDSAGTYRYAFTITGTTLSSAIDLIFTGFSTGFSSPILSAIDDGTNIVVASENFVWTISGTTATHVTALGAAPTSGYAGLLYLTSGTEYYLTVRSNGTNGGGIYSGTTLAGLTALKTGLTYSSTAVSPAGMLYNGSAGSGVIWVGTLSGSASYEGTGFLEITSPSSSPSVNVTPSTASVSSSNYTSTSLYIHATPTLFKGSTGYFVGTLSHGLWSWSSSDQTFAQQ